MCAHFEFCHLLNICTQEEERGHLLDEHSMANQILKFSAGRCEYDENTKIYTPLETPGEIIIEDSEEGEGCYNWIWKPRLSSSHDQPDELLIFSTDVVWRRINSCTSGRVYMLGFLSSGAKHLYWMQDVNDDKAGDNDDDEVLSKESVKDKSISEKIKKLLGDPEYE